MYEERGVRWSGREVLTSFIEIDLVERKKAVKGGKRGRRWRDERIMELRAGGATKASTEVERGGVRADKPLPLRYPLYLFFFTLFFEGDKAGQYAAAI